MKLWELIVAGTIAVAVVVIAPLGCFAGIAYVVVRVVKEVW